MSLRPRHYILLVIILGLFVFNIIRHRRDNRSAISNTAPAPVIVTKPRLNTPAWAAFDHAAALRDDPAATFTPALDDLHQLIPSTPIPTTATSPTSTAASPGLSSTARAWPRPTPMPR